MKPTKILPMLVWVALLTISAPAHSAPPPSKPNIIMILSDDVGLGNISCCGGSFPTPQIDRLAQSGMRFELCYSTPLCGPSRCQLLTGRYPFRTGLINNQSHNAIQPGREIMIPTVLKQAGYATCSVGKWGQMSFGPGEWGFDQYLVFSGSGRYWGGQKGGYRVNGESKSLGKEEYLPEIMHQFAVDFIRSHQQQPFFLYYPMSHIHGPILRTPDSKAGASEEQLYRDNVACMDQLVGRLMAELDRLHLRERTLVIFAGDNGTAHFGVKAATVNGRPISGQKGSMLEGGSRVPMVATWPGTMPQGKVCRDLIDFTDFLPTFAELARTKPPEGVKWDGRSFAPQLRGEPGRPREWVYVELNGRSYARDARFKLTNQGELFDLINAPFEEKTVARDTRDEQATAARQRLQAILDEHPAAKGNPEGKSAVKVRKRARRSV
jgi:arylsulfatase A